MMCCCKKFILARAMCGLASFCWNMPPFTTCGVCIHMCCLSEPLSIQCPLNNTRSVLWFPKIPHQTMTPSAQMGHNDIFHISGRHESNHHTTVTRLIGEEHSSPLNRHWVYSRQCSTWHHLKQGHLYDRLALKTDAMKPSVLRRFCKLRCPASASLLKASLILGGCQ